MSIFVIFIGLAAGGLIIRQMNPGVLGGSFILLLCVSCSISMIDLDPRPIHDAEQTAQASSEIVVVKPPSSAGGEVIREEVDESPIKTQITQRLYSTNARNPDVMEKYLMQQYEQVRARTGFQYHAHPTHIFLYVYGSEAEARYDSSIWTAMLMKRSMDNAPEITVREFVSARTVYDSPRNPAAENRAHRIFDELVRLQDAQIMDDRAAQEYIARKYGLSMDEMLQICVEGVRQGWLD